MRRITLQLPHASLSLADALPPLAIASLVYQAVVVAFVSYLAWFWLLTRYMASRLSVCSFLTPIFGVLLLGEHFTTRFMFAATMVLAGITLVNRGHGQA